MDKVSIIVPAYNVEKYVSNTLDSVKNQTYQDWECIVVDDCSTDNTASIIQEYCKSDLRFIYIRLNNNSGAAIARNTAIKKASGRYLAFIDSDDIWLPQKLEKQILFMKNNNYYFSCTDYGKIDADSNVRKMVVKAKKIYDYKEVLKNCPGNSTVIYDCENIGKVYAENIRRRNDFVMWLKVIKVASKAYGYNEVLTFHRERKNSISYKKTMLLKYQWTVYRKIENLSFGYSLYLTSYKILQVMMAKIQRYMSVIEEGVVNGVWVGGENER